MGKRRKSLEIGNHTVPRQQKVSLKTSQFAVISGPICGLSCTLIKSGWPSGEKLLPTPVLKPNWHGILRWQLWKHFWISLTILLPCILWYMYVYFLKSSIPPTRVSKPGRWDLSTCPKTNLRGHKIIKKDISLHRILFNLPDLSLVLALWGYNLWRGVARGQRFVEKPMVTKSSQLLKKFHIIHKSCIKVHVCHRMYSVKI